MHSTGNGSRHLKMFALDPQLALAYHRPVNGCHLLLRRDKLDKLEGSGQSRIRPDPLCTFLAHVLRILGFQERIPPLPPPSLPLGTRTRTRTCTCTSPTPRGGCHDCQETGNTPRRAKS